MKKVLACNFIKKRLPNRCFPVHLAKYLRTPFEEHLWKSAPDWYKDIPYWTEDFNWTHVRRSENATPRAHTFFIREEVVKRGCFAKIGSENFAKLKRKYLHWSLFFNEVEGRRPSILSKDSGTSAFLWILGHFAKTVPSGKISKFPLRFNRLKIFGDWECSVYFSWLIL